MMKGVDINPHVSQAPTHEPQPLHSPLPSIHPNQATTQPPPAQPTAMSSKLEPDQAMLPNPSQVVHTLPPEPSPSNPILPAQETSPVQATQKTQDSGKKETAPVQATRKTPPVQATKQVQVDIGKKKFRKEPSPTQQARLDIHMAARAKDPAAGLAIYERCKAAGRPFLHVFGCITSVVPVKLD
jgi:hypothetical protein